MVTALAATVVAVGGAATISPTSAEVQAETPIKFMRSVETDAEGWTFVGFDPIENDNASRSFEHGTFSAGATAEYKFKSDRIELFGYKGPIGGSLKIEIDGKDKETVSLDGAEDAYKSKIASYELDSDAWHTLKITSATDGKWHAIDYVNVALDKAVYEKYYNLALVGDIICSVPNPTGGGNKDLNVIRNEKYYAVGTSAGPLQYDSFHNSGREIFYMGYSYSTDMTFAKLVFQEGATWATGGWFADGEISVQVRSGGSWKTVETTKPVGYPVGDAQSDFGENCETYTFEFEPITGDAIRIYGMTGGTENFVSVAQIEVYGACDVKTIAEGWDYKQAVHYEVGGNRLPDGDGSNGGGENGVDLGLAVGLPVGLVAVAAAAAVTFVVVRRKKEKTKSDGGNNGGENADDD